MTKTTCIPEMYVHGVGLKSSPAAGTVECNVINDTHWNRYTYGLWLTEGLISSWCFHPGSRTGSRYVLCTRRSQNEFSNRRLFNQSTHAQQLRIFSCDLSCWQRRMTLHVLRQNFTPWQPVTVNSWIIKRTPYDQR
jgi:hypothetical protein